ARTEGAAGGIWEGWKGPNPLLTGAIGLRLKRLSSPAARLFQFLLTQQDPVDDSVAGKALELFEIDEPLRALRRERLLRVRKTGDLQEIDVYHPRMRELLVGRRSRAAGPHGLADAERDRVPSPIIRVG